MPRPRTIDAGTAGALPSPWSRDRSRAELRSPVGPGTFRCSSVHRDGDVALFLQQPVPGVKGHAEASTEPILGPPAVPEPDQLFVSVDPVGDDLVTAANRGTCRELDHAGLRVGGVETAVPVHAGDHRAHHEGLECMLDAEGVVVGGDHAELFCCLADHEAGTARIVGWVGLCLLYTSPSPR